MWRNRPTQRQMKSVFGEPSKQKSCDDDESVGEN